MSRNWRSSTFVGRVEELRASGATCARVGAYAEAVLEMSRNCPSLSFSLDEDTVRAVLTPDELAACIRIRGQKWRARARSQIESSRAERRRVAELPVAEARLRNLELEAAEAEREAVRLRRAGAMSRARVAAALGVTPAVVDRLRSSGLLRPDGLIPIQWSRGRKCYVWLPDTIARYRRHATLRRVV